MRIKDYPQISKIEGFKSLELAKAWQLIKEEYFSELKPEQELSQGYTQTSLNRTVITSSQSDHDMD